MAARRLKPLERRGMRLSLRLFLSGPSISYRHTWHNCNAYKPVGAPHIPSLRCSKIVHVQRPARSRWHMANTGPAHLLLLLISIDNSTRGMLMIDRPPREDR